MPIQTGIEPDTQCRIRVLHLGLSEDEFALINWVRFKHQPAKLDAWARDALIAQAREHVRQRIDLGKNPPQWVADVIERLRDKQGFKT